MDLHPTTEQLEIVDSVTDYLGNELPATRLPHQTDTALSPQQWRDLAEMGWIGLGLPEAAGGLGLGLVEEALVVREFGRHLLPPAVLATMLAAHAAHGLSNDALATALTSGQVRAAFAIPDDDQERWRLLDSDSADLFLAVLPDRALLIPREAFLASQAQPSFDASLEVMTATGLDEEGITTLMDGDKAFTHRMRVLVAAALTGGAEAIRDLSAEYAKVRHQFGRPIGEFQAISHKCAAMAVNSDAALSIMQYAAVSVRDGSPEADMYSAAAVMVAGSAAYNGACDSMQIHGGYGQTYEYLPHFYLKRAILYQLCGTGSTLNASIIEAQSTL